MVPDTAQAALDNLPAEVRQNFGLDNDGNLVYRNRAYRRNFGPNDPRKTKSSWSYKPHRELKRLRKLGRK